LTGLGVQVAGATVWAADAKQDYELRIFSYQGEENSGRPQEYAPLIRGLITSWRARWGVEWPFYYVELANTRSPQTKPSEGGWALIREAQGAALALPKTGVVTAVDLGDGKIHPWNKKAVGERLVALAMADVHGRVSAEVRSPEYVSHVIEGALVRLQFDHAGGLRVRGDQGIRGFAIAGSDGMWRWADAKIMGEQIEVSSPEVAVPVAVRYGWASNPVLSIENEAGLPLRPFRTDREIQ
jgi:sialate O-acetylesterase